MGYESKAYGDLAEQLAETSFRYYAAREQLFWTKTFPEVKVFSKDGGKQVRLTGQGPPDYCLALRGYRGRLLWLEIKEWLEPMKGKNQGRFVLGERIHQYLIMKDYASVGAVGCYLVAWRQPDNSFHWRLHPILTLERDERGRIIFIKAEGLAVPDPDGYPLWLLTLIQSES
ncbi:MAG: hypothetical protein KJ077_11280 [Anaerolineae bacterium]|nr:hypothetical protein [Anaerolineae bacterium]